MGALDMGRRLARERDTQRQSPRPAPAGLVIRPAGRNDAARVVAMAAELSADEKRPPPSFGVREYLRDGFGSNPAFSVLLAELAGRRMAVGYALFYGVYDVESASRGVHLGDLWVEPPSRRLGVGRALLAALARDTRRSGARFLTWQAFDQNAAAIAFYEAIGGRRVKSVAFDMGPEQLDRIARHAP